MAEDQDQSQKTEEPTAKKLQDAMEKGEVAKSQEVKHFFILLAATLMVLISGASTMGGVSDSLARILEFSYEIPTDPQGLQSFLARLFGQIGFVLILPVILLLAGALVGTVIQHKPMLSVEKIKPKLNKISPLSGLKRLFSMQNVAEISKSILKICIVAAVVFILIWPDRNLLEQMMTHAISDVVQIVYQMVLRMLGGVIFVMAIIAGLDYLFQRFQFMKQMRMTKQEIKDEMKQTDGDPMVKARLRQIRMERSRKRMMAAVPEADVVVTNPTHFAVALKYQQGAMEVPVVVAKGVDNIALKIREIAEENNIPILENPPLARTLHAAVEIDDEIHPEHYRAVAEVIGYILKLKAGQRASYRPTLKPGEKPA
ncbi:flagellar biosynthesis protein FlhB [Emcibacter sp.]|uniref:flagellar biosynthesis protein FlhB n=1 Tax=Emcibacter sp. TaxID=1979954 RepID=UPI003A8E0B67